MNDYRIYGRNLRSSFRFENRLLPAAGEPELYFGAVAGPAFDASVHKLVYQTEPPIYDGKAELYLFKGDDEFVFEFTGASRFHVKSQEILFEVTHPEYSFLTEIYFLGIIMSAWLELQGVIALHSAAVAVGDRAAGFVGLNQAGKSTLAASLMNRGHGLMTDDVLAVEKVEGRFVAHPGYPQMRMWPEMAMAFGLDPGSLPRVHPEFDKVRVPVGEGGFGRMRREAAELSRIYVVNRDDRADAPAVQPMTSSEAMSELLRTSFAGLVLGGIEVSHTRLPVVAQLVGEVPVRRLTYPANRFEAALEMIEEDMRGRL